MKTCSKHRQYPLSALADAYKLVKETGIPVKTAARQYGVPQNTLRDRVKGRVNPDTTKTGPDPLFVQEEEIELVNYIKSLAELGYGCTIPEMLAIASDYAVFLKKRKKDQPLSKKWYIGFRSRWPELKDMNLKPLSKLQAIPKTQQAVEDYFKNLEIILLENGLLDKPEYIFNIDVIKIEYQVEPTSAFGDSSLQDSDVTTIIGAGNAFGTCIPPYFIFKGKRLSKDLLEGATNGTAAAMSQTGFSNCHIFREYLKKHFINYIQRPDASQTVIILLDGHKSHINVPALEWAKTNNIIFFVLPAHTSHLLQPLEVGCFDLLQKLYKKACRTFLRAHTSAKITRSNIAAIASSPYVTALSPSKIKSSFQQTGIYPFSKDVVRVEDFKPVKMSSKSQCKDQLASKSKPKKRKAVKTLSIVPVKKPH